jgi:hypothetical protein
MAKGYQKQRNKVKLVKGKIGKSSKRVEDRQLRVELSDWEKEFRYKYPFGLLNIIDLVGGERHTK